MGLLKLDFLLVLFLISGFCGCVHGGDGDEDSVSDSELTKLVYRGCAAHKFPDPTGVFSQNVKNLFDSLVSRAAAGKGYAAATSGGETGNAAMGLYQCRGDLSDEQCGECVAKLPPTSDKLCGRTAAVRVQLYGCYLRYEVVGFGQFGMADLLYKVCGSAGDGFEERRDAVAEMVVNGLKNSSSAAGGGGDGLFYTGSYRDVYVLGQCEGGLAAEDCRSCVKTALDTAKAKCGSSISAQIYLSRCYISYSYYSNGVPTISSSSSSGL